MYLSFALISISCSPSEALTFCTEVVPDVCRWFNIAFQILQRRPPLYEEPWRTVRENSLISIALKWARSKTWKSQGYTSYDNTQKTEHFFEGIAKMLSCLFSIWFRCLEGCGKAPNLDKCQNLDGLKHSRCCCYAVSVKLFTS